MRIAAASLAFALAALAAGTALAADGKTIAAADCFKTGSMSPGDRGELENFTTVGIEVACTLPRDNPAARLAKVEVSVIDNTAGIAGTNDFSCRVAIVDRFARVIAVGATRGTTGTNTQGTVLALPVPAGNLVKGNYFVFCKVPRQSAFDEPSRLASIYYEEASEP
ncbi:hypothetical protein [Oharaeibacter diazotrophicus]|uniref:Spore coat protein U-like protein n=1 Tax=Oharaeibacter diazotrophicus TaxID=1920512 RepID=A0A4R6RK85_9HYPH|nr:hypothetical protein [Oharaeibacter diazotrophicus]TDP86999.1 hypothetical protein EDD54_0884 [Oharaeibacter diazotrophicus]BBE71058.1 hypothetical protein OHA_1_00628 [Pleomorphomonas sp. SM30]